MSLIEILVSVGLLGIVVGTLATVVAKNKQAQRDLTDRLKSRQVMDRAMSSIISTPGHFPPAKYEDMIMTYVGCFNRDGMITPNQKNSQKEFVAVAIKDPSKLPDEKSEICWNNLDDPASKDHAKKSRFEIHVTPNPNKPGTAMVRAFVLDPNKSSKSDVVKRKEGQNTSGKKWFYEVEIEFESSL